MTPDLHSYDHILVFFSGGKDSLACVLHLLQRDVDPARIQLWHHKIDGPDDVFMDWPCTPAYCQAIAQHLRLPLYFSWKEGGFRRELLRENAPTAQLTFQTPSHTVGEPLSSHTVGGTRPHLATRRRWPAVSANLTRRWCSSYLKIDPATAAIRHHPDFQGKHILTISGERAQESTGALWARSRYLTFEKDRSDNRHGKRNPRHVDRWRPVHGWDAKHIWGIIEHHRLAAHPVTSDFAVQ